MNTGAFSTLPDRDDYNLAYTDDDGDLVLITADSDVRDSTAVARHQGRDRVVLVLQGGKTWEDAIRASGGDPNTIMHPASRRPYKRRETLAPQSGGDLHAKAADASAAARPDSMKKQGKDDLVLGFLPKDLALPAAIGFLGLSVIGAVALVRVGARA